MNTGPWRLDNHLFSSHVCICVNVSQWWSQPTICRWQTMLQFFTFVRAKDGETNNLADREHHVCKLIWSLCRCSISKLEPWISEGSQQADLNYVPFHCNVQWQFGLIHVWNLSLKSQVVPQSGCSFRRVGDWHHEPQETKSEKWQQQHTPIHKDTIECFFLKVFPLCCPTFILFKKKSVFLFVSHVGLFSLLLFFPWSWERIARTVINGLEQPPWKQFVLQASKWKLLRKWKRMDVSALWNWYILLWWWWPDWKAKRVYFSILRNDLLQCADDYDDARQVTDIWLFFNSPVFQVQLFEFRRVCLAQSLQAWQLCGSRFHIQCMWCLSLVASATRSASCRPVSCQWVTSTAAVNGQHLLQELWKESLCA